jgi:hypothetical protein
MFHPVDPPPKMADAIDQQREQSAGSDGLPPAGTSHRLRPWVFLVIGLGTLMSLAYMATQYQAGVLPPFDAAFGLVFHIIFLLVLVWIADRVRVIDLDRRSRVLAQRYRTPADPHLDRAWEAPPSRSGRYPALILPLPLWLVIVPAFIVVKWLVIGVGSLVWLVFRIVRFAVLELVALDTNEKPPPVTKRRRSPKRQAAAASNVVSFWAPRARRKRAGQ